MERETESVRLSGPDSPPNREAAVPAACSTVLLLTYSMPQGGSRGEPLLSCPTISFERSKTRVA